MPAVVEASSVAGAPTSSAEDEASSPHTKQAALGGCSTASLQHNKISDRFLSAAAAISDHSNTQEHAGGAGAGTNLESHLRSTQDELVDGGGEAKKQGRAQNEPEALSDAAAASDSHKVGAAETNNSNPDSGGGGGREKSLKWQSQDEYAQAMALISSLKDQLEHSASVANANDSAESTKNAEISSSADSSLIPEDSKTSESFKANPEGGGDTAEISSLTSDHDSFSSAKSGGRELSCQENTTRDTAGAVASVALTAAAEAVRGCAGHKRRLERTSSMDKEEPNNIIRKSSIAGSGLFRTKEDAGDDNSTAAENSPEKRSPLGALTPCSIATPPREERDVKTAMHRQKNGGGDTEAVTNQAAAASAAMGDLDWYTVFGRSTSSDNDNSSELSAERQKSDAAAADDTSSPDHLHGREHVKDVPSSVAAGAMQSRETSDAPRALPAALIRKPPVPIRRSHSDLSVASQLQQTSALSDALRIDEKGTDYLEAADLRAREFLAPPGEVLRDISDTADFLSAADESHTPARLQATSGRLRPMLERSSSAGPGAALFRRTTSLHNDQMMQYDDDAEAETSNKSLGLRQLPDQQSPIGTPPPRYLHEQQGGGGRAADLDHEPGRRNYFASLRGQCEDVQEENKMYGADCAMTAPGTPPTPTMHRTVTSEPFFRDFEPQRRQEIGRTASPESTPEAPESRRNVAPSKSTLQQTTSSQSAQEVEPATPPSSGVAATTGAFFAQREDPYSTPLESGSQQRYTADAATPSLTHQSAENALRRPNPSSQAQATVPFFAPSLGPRPQRPSPGLNIPTAQAQELQGLGEMMRVPHPGDNARAAAEADAWVVAQDAADAASAAAAMPAAATSLPSDMDLLIPPSGDAAAVAGGVSAPGSLSNAALASMMAAHLAGGQPSGGQPTNQLYKTELCRSWEETWQCRYGSKCQFAHGAEDLRPVARHPKYKTEICRTFASTGTCPYGTRCRFIHLSAADRRRMSAVAASMQQQKQQQAAAVAGETSAQQLHVAAAAAGADPHFATRLANAREHLGGGGGYTASKAGGAIADSLAQLTSRGPPVQPNLVQAAAQKIHPQTEMFQEQQNPCTPPRGTSCAEARFVGHNNPAGDSNLQAVNQSQQRQILQLQRQLDHFQFAKCDDSIPRAGHLEPSTERQAKVADQSGVQHQLNRPTARPAAAAAPAARGANFEYEGQIHCSQSNMMMRRSRAQDTADRGPVAPISGRHGAVMLQAADAHDLMQAEYASAATADHLQTSQFTAPLPTGGQHYDLLMRNSHQQHRRVAASPAPAPIAMVSNDQAHLHGLAPAAAVRRRITAPAPRLHASSVPGSMSSFSSLSIHAAATESNSSASGGGGPPLSRPRSSFQLSSENSSLSGHHLEQQHRNGGNGAPLQSRTSSAHTTAHPSPFQAVAPQAGVNPVAAQRVAMSSHDARATEAQAGAAVPPGTDEATDMAHRLPIFANKDLGHARRHTAPPAGTGSEPFYTQRQ